MFSFKREARQIMKKLIPFVVSYLMIAAGTAAIMLFSSHTGSSLFYTLNTALPHDELVAKLQQVGIPESALHLATRTPAPLDTVIYLFVEYGIGFGVFLGLACLIERLIAKSRP
jgi:hypothetical protein